MAQKHIISQSTLFFTATYTSYNIIRYVTMYTRYTTKTEGLNLCHLFLKITKIRSIPYFSVLSNVPRKNTLVDSSVSVKV